MVNRTMPQPDHNFQQWLEEWIEANGGQAGTLHLHEQGELRLVAAHRIPPPVLAAVRIVPRGRGMAGLALERGRPVQTCNLQEDTTGDIRPGAKAVGAKAAVALPVHNSDGSIHAIAGIAFAHEEELDAGTLASLARGFATLPGAARPAGAPK